MTIITQINNVKTQVNNVKESFYNYIVILLNSLQKWFSDLIEPILVPVQVGNY